MDLASFVFDLPLYVKVTETDGYDYLFNSLKSANKDIHIDGYSPQTKKETTFLLSKGFADEMTYNSSWEHFDRSFKSSLCRFEFVSFVTFTCQRYGNQIHCSVYNNPEDKYLMKFGQYPSVADIHIGQIKQYDKVLSKNLLKEFTRAIGLAANGVGIGSFVYLRRFLKA